MAKGPQVAFMSGTRSPSCPDRAAQRKCLSSALSQAKDSNKEQDKNQPENKERINTTDDRIL